MGIAPDLIKELFHLSMHAYDLRSSYEFKRENGKTVHYGNDSLSFLRPNIWELVTFEIKSCKTLQQFKG